MRGVPAHLGQPFTLLVTFSYTIRPLLGLFTGATCSLARCITPSYTRLPSPCHIVLDAILAAKLPLNDPLAIAAICWQQFMLHRSAVPSIFNVYTKTHTLLQVSFEHAAKAHGAIGEAWTLELWLDMLPYFFVALNTFNMFPRPWEDSMHDLCSIQLQMA